MMEHTTDRLFWTLTSIIIAALLLTIGVKTFPQLTQNVLQPVSGMLKQADTTNSHVNDAVNQVLNQSNDSTSQNTQQQLTPDQQDAQDKANAVEASTLGFTITDNGDNTGTITGYNASKGNNINIPSYMKLNGKMLKITIIGFAAFENNQLTSVNIPNSVTNIGVAAFTWNNLTSITIPNTVTNIGNGAFSYNNIKSVNIPNSVINLGKNIFYMNNNNNVTINRTN